MNRRVMAGVMALLLIIVGSVSAVRNIDWFSLRSGDGMALPRTPEQTQAAWRSLPWLVTKMLSAARHLPSGNITIPGPWGHLEIALAEHGQEKRYALSCQRCRIALDWLHHQAIEGLSVTIEGASSGSKIVGTARIDRIRIDFEMAIDGAAVTGRYTMPAIPIRTFYQVFAGAIPELSRAAIAGRVSVSGDYSLTGRRISVTPVVQGFEVRGLGTESLRYGRFQYARSDADGRRIIGTSGDGSANWASLSALGRWLPRAVVAGEDTRYFEHPGYDLHEIRAAFDGKARLRGASTLSQQLAKNLFVGGRRTLIRKLRELLYAVEMEQTLGKQRILELYLNLVEWGPDIYGAKAAAQRYFAKSAQQLQPQEAAWLAGILRHPRKAWETQYLLGQVDPARMNWILRRTPGVPRAHRDGLITQVKFAIGK